MYVQPKNAWVSVKMKFRLYPVRNISFINLGMLLLFLTFSNISFAQNELIIQTSGWKWSTLSSFDLQKAQDYGIIIKPNGELTIDADAEMWRDIRIESTTSSGVNGGRLIIKKKISNWNAPFPKGGPTWTGIVMDGIAPDVNGYHPSHFTTLPATSPLEDLAAFYGVLDDRYAKVILENGAIIENAEHGILASDGAIVESMSGFSTSSRPKFVNCHTGIELDGYQPPLADKNASAYRLNNIIFTQNANDPWRNIGGFDVKDRVHIKLSNLHGGPYIGGCFFESIKQTLYTICWNERGTGVEASNSQFYIGEAGNVFHESGDCIVIKEKNNTSATLSGSFSNLSAAIAAENTGKIHRMELSNHSFQQNLKSIETTNYWMSVRDCSFEAFDADLSSNLFNQGGSCGTSDPKFHIKTEDTDELLVYNNEFEYNNSLVGGATNYGTEPSMEIHVASGGGKILIQKNDPISGDVSTSNMSSYGILASGDLSNFEWLCNNFVNNTVHLKYSGTGPSQNPTSGNVNVENSYSSGATLTIDNQTSTTVTYYSSSNPSPNNNVNWSTGSVRSGECELTCDEAKTKFKASISQAEKVKPRLYPNPASSKITILDMHNFLSGDYNLSIFNNQGQLVRYESRKIGENEISISDLDSGLYFIQIESDRGNFASKIAVQR